MIVTQMDWGVKCLQKNRLGSEQPPMSPGSGGGAALPRPLRPHGGMPRGRGPAGSSPGRAAGVGRDAVDSLWAPSVGWWRWITACRAARLTYACGEGGEPPGRGRRRRPCSPREEGRRRRLTLLCPASRTRGPPLRLRGRKKADSARHPAFGGVPTTKRKALRTNPWDRVERIDSGRR